MNLAIIFHNKLKIFMKNIYFLTLYKKYVMLKIIRIVKRYNMCGRYYIEISDEELKDIADKVAKKAKLDYRNISLKTNGEIYPADAVPVQTGVNEYLPMIWGFAMQGKKLLINARFETFTQKPTFKNCSRCLIPTSGYFEWKRDVNPKVKYSFTDKNKPVYLAALFRTENDESHFVILTREAVGKAAEIHHRMPVIVPHDSIEDWFSENFNLSQAITNVIREEAAAQLGQIRFDD
jgi:putative SOS response-associated peptidase YedK